MKRHPDRPPTMASMLIPLPVCDIAAWQASLSGAYGGCRSGVSPPPCRYTRHCTLGLAWHMRASKMTVNLSHALFQMIHSHSQEYRGYCSGIVGCRSSAPDAHVTHQLPCTTAQTHTAVIQYPRAIVGSRSLTTRDHMQSAAVERATDRDV